ncbi:hypothetisches protein [mine drainage metagenome]|uniref:Hypothetisches protein n=1 Tax=mine drainage metagenome TaxID=410659 RepID=A0A1J5QE09_9ZZZZ
MSIEIPVTEARDRFSELLETASEQPVFLTKHGRRQAVLLSPAEYERLMEAAEDAEDLSASDEAMAKIMAGSPTIPWEQVKADLGIA